MPEYLSQAKQALARGYSVLALQSADEGSGCWSSSTRDGRVDDRPRVRARRLGAEKMHAGTCPQACCKPMA
jgi:hypothetical protein